MSEAVKKAGLARAAEKIEEEQRKWAAEEEARAREREREAREAAEERAREKRVREWRESDGERDWSETVERARERLTLAVADVAESKEAVRAAEAKLMEAEKEIPRKMVPVMEREERLKRLRGALEWEKEKAGWAGNRLVAAYEWRVWVANQDRERMREFCLEEWKRTHE